MPTTYFVTVVATHAFLRPVALQNGFRVHAVASEPASEPKTPPAPAQMQLAALQVRSNRASGGLAVLQLVKLQLYCLICKQASVLSL